MALTDAWVMRSSPENNGWHAMARSELLGLFVMVAYTGSGTRVAKSTDGISWTAVTNPGSSFDWRHVIWVDDLTLFVAVGFSGKIMTSPDGDNWTLATTPASNSWVRITWVSSLQLLVTCAYGGTNNRRIMTSPDGDNWTAVTLPAAYSVLDVAWSSKLQMFAAVANLSGVDYVLTSPNGGTWTQRAAAATKTFSSLTWSDELELFVAVGESGVGSRAMVSNNGINWYLRPTPADYGWVSVIFEKTLMLFVALAHVGGTTDKIMTSADGQYWELRAMPANLSWRNLSYSAALSRFVASAYNTTGNRVATWSFSKIPLLIDESLAATQFTARAVAVGSGELLGNGVGSAPGFNVSTLDTSPCYVTVSPDVGDRWYPDRFYALNAKAFPTDPIATPYYYKRIAIGTSGATEPTWLTTPGAQVDDGAVPNAWELVERLSQPITHGPLIPS